VDIEITDEKLIAVLIGKYLDGIASDDEINQVENWYHSLISKPSFLASLTDKEQKIISEKMFLIINSSINTDEDLSDSNHFNEEDKAIIEKNNTKNV